MTCRALGVLVVAGAILAKPSSGFGQLRPKAIAGCYAFSIGAWSPPLTDRLIYLVAPPMIRLDTLRVGRTSGWRLSPNLAYSRAPKFATTPRWELHGDGLELMWTQGGPAMTVTLYRRDLEWIGEAVALADTGTHHLAPASRAPASLRRQRCLSPGSDR